jgi:hypothetical protein
VALCVRDEEGEGGRYWEREKCLEIIYYY